VSCAGCFQIHTAEVRVRDTSRVELESKDGQPVLPEGAGDGVVQRGKYYELFTPEPYEVRASRDSAGGISLHCDTCARAGFPLSGSAHVDLLEPSGRSLPTLAWDVAIENDKSRVVADYDVCMVQGHRTCEVNAQTRLVAPMSDVVEVRRRAEPVRIWGYVLLGMSALMVGAASWYTFASHSGTLEERALWGAVTALPALAFGGVGLWEVLTPATEQIWRPTVGSR
jgi:hypothetical protein